MPYLYLIFLSLYIGTAQPVWAEGANVFNQLVIKKAEMEKRHGITSLECFPFIANIGSDSDQARWVERCQQGVQTLSRALDEMAGGGGPPSTDNVAPTALLVAPVVCRSSFRPLHPFTPSYILEPQSYSRSSFSFRWRGQFLLSPRSFRKVAHER